MSNSLMDHNNNSDKLSQKNLSYRKTPKELYINKSSTWSSSSVKHMLNNSVSQNNRLDITERSNFSSNQTLSIEERIKLYEAKYMQCMNSQTLLSEWVKSAKEKGPPRPLIEGNYTPPVRSRLPDFLFSSLSTKPRRKAHTLICETAAPAAKSSLSTFLKKATDSLSTTYKQVPPLKRQQKIAFPAPKSPTFEATACTADSSNNQQHRFSLTSSLNRFSLVKTSHSNIKLASKSSYTNIEPNIDKEAASPKVKLSNRYKRFSIPPPEKKTTTSSDVCDKSNTNHNINSMSKHNPKAQRPQSTILPHSPSSIFLERLRSRAPGNDIVGEKQCQTIQSNVSSKPVTSYSCLQSSASSIGIADDDTPPSSPSSIDSVSTSPSITTPSLAPIVSITTAREVNQQNNKRNQDFFSLSKHKSSLLTAVDKKGIMDDVIVEDEHEEAFIRDCNPYPLKSLPLQQQQQQQLQQKKKRESLLIIPSLSSIRLISQKSQFLRRQSMLT